VSGIEQAIGVIEQLRVDRGDEAGNLDGDGRVSGGGFEIGGMEMRAIRR
jgi:hypothetical protein